MGSRTEPVAVRSHDESGGFAHQCDWPGSSDSLGDDGVVPPVAVTAAALTLFLNVLDLSARRHLAIASHDAAASEGSEAEQPNETVHRLRPFIEPEARYVPLQAGFIRPQSCTYIGTFRRERTSFSTVFEVSGSK